MSKVRPQPWLGFGGSRSSLRWKNTLFASICQKLKEKNIPCFRQLSYKDTIKDEMESRKIDQIENRKFLLREVAILCEQRCRVINSLIDGVMRMWGTTQNQKLTEEEMGNEVGSSRAKKLSQASKSQDHFLACEPLNFFQFMTHRLLVWLQLRVIYIQHLDCDKISIHLASAVFNLIQASAS